MAWTQQLYQTYERLSTEDCGLTPLAHMYAKAQMEITIDQAADFIDATIVPKDNEKTLIPVTEASSGRSSGSAPHALNDTLAYISGDFIKYLDPQKKKEKKISMKKHQDYINALENWCLSEYCNEKADIILSYLKKEEVISDLIQAGLIQIENGIFTEKKIGGQEYAKALVRFRVINGSEEDRTWEDERLIADYTSYYLANQKGEKDICYITGRNQTTSENHPKNMVSAYGNAKLISANDNSGFTFRGRFENSRQANTVSYEASQKMHSALKWLVSNQGKMIGNTNRRVFVSWNPEGKDTGNFIDDYLVDMRSEDESYAVDQQAYREKLDRMLKGYREQYDDNDCVVIMGMDAATTGRLSVTYYQELLASDYWNNINYWGNTVKWYYLKFDQNKRPHNDVETPNLIRIINLAYGTEREYGNYKRVESDDAVLKEHVQRLVKCMIERQRIPRDIVIALYQKASRLLTYSKGNRELLLSTVCALITKQLIDNGRTKEDNPNNMRLDKENTNRSYLFGRLLAIYEMVEKQAMDRDENRDTNAMRLQAAFVNHPARTWEILEKATRHCFAKLNPGSRGFYKQLVAEIVSTFVSEEEAKRNQALSEEYLLGYYLQRMELNSGRTKTEEKENE